MNYSDLSRKMLLHNLHVFSVFIGGNILSVALLLTFASLYMNRAFMNETIVDPMISSNIIFSGVLVLSFFVVMIFVSERVFWKERQREYAVMTVLGMSKKEAVISIVRENVFAVACLIPAALIMGTVLSFCFYAVIRYVIGLEGIRWLDNGKGYAVTITLYVLLSLTAVIINAVIYIKEKLILQLKEVENERDGLLARVIRVRAPRLWNHLLPQIAFVKLHRRLWNVRYVIECVLISGMMFLIGICVSMYPSFLDNADVYSPYDMLYTEINGVNRAEHEEIVRILNENNVEITEYRQFEFARNTVFNFVAVSDVNAIFGCDYEVHDGECINLFQFDERDGYEHDMTPASVVNVSDRTASTNTQSLSDELILTSAGSDVNILWNPNQAFADRTLIVSDSDFNRIKNIKDCRVGKANIYRFLDWRTTSKAVEQVEQYLQQKNGLKWEEQYNYRISSHTKQYERARQSGRFLIFVMSFVVLVLLLASLSISFLGLSSERNEHMMIEAGLYGIGVTRECIAGYQMFCNRVRYLIPVIIGEIIGLLVVILWNRAAYQMRFSVVMMEIVIAGVIMLCVLRIAESEKIKQNH